MRQQRRSRRRSTFTMASFGRRAGMIVCIFFGLTFSLGPFLWLLATALKEPVEIFRNPPTILPDDPTFSNFLAVIGRDSSAGAQDYSILPAMKNSLVVAISAAAIATFVGFTGGFVLAKKRARIIAILISVLFIIRFIPRISIAIPLYSTVGLLGQMDSLLGIIITHLAVVAPLATFLMYSFLKDFPDELLEAASIDGASKGTAVLRIVAPLSKTGLAVAAILGFVYSYNEFLYSLIIVSTDSSQTLPVALSQFILAYGIQWNYLSAAGVVAVLPVIIVGLALQKHIVRGLSIGALK